MGLIGKNTKGRDGAYTPSVTAANLYGKSIDKTEKRVEALNRAGAKGDPKQAKSN